MTRLTRWIVGASLLGLATGGVVLPSVARRRVEAAVLERCARRDDVACQLNSVQLATDGVLLEGLRVSTRDQAVRARLDRVAVRLNWVRLALGLHQHIAVRVAGVELAGADSLDGLRARLSRRPERHAEGARRFTLRRVDLEGLDARFRLGLTPDRAAQLEAHGVSAHWATDEALSVEWADASAELGPHRGQLRGCGALRRSDFANLTCQGFDAETELSDLSNVLNSVQQGLRSGRRAAPGAESAAPSADAEPSPTVRTVRLDEALTEGPRWSVQLREGTVRVRQRRELLFALQPASLAIEGAGRRVEQLRAQLGGDGAGQTALALVYAQPIERPWRLQLDASEVPLARVVPWAPGVPWHATEEGRFEAHVTVDPTEAEGGVEVAGSVRVENFGLSHPGLAREPVDGLSVEASGRILVDRLRRRVATAGVHANLNGVQLSLSGWAEHDREHTALDASVAFPPMDCDLPRRALPRTVVGPLYGFGFQGTLGGSAHVAVDTRRLSNTLLDWDVLDACRVIHPSAETSLTRFAGPFVQHVLERGGLQRNFITGPESPNWTPIDAITPALVGAVVVREDGGFYRHQGFSRDEVRGALVRNLQLGRFAFGASTLSMQLVKNVFLAREKTLVRKLQEVALTWWIEQSFDKRSIMELYLNVVEFGPGIYGVGPAARFFFGREPAELSLLQAIYLATLLPAPVPRFANFERQSVSPETLARLRAVARNMAANHLITPAEAAAAQAETLTFRAARSAIPQPQTLEVGPEVTDEAARTMVERMGVRPAAPATSTETPDDGPAEASPGVE